MSENLHYREDVQAYAESQPCYACGKNPAGDSYMDIDQRYVPACPKCKRILIKHGSYLTKDAWADLVSRSK